MMKQHKSIIIILPLIALVLMSCQFATINIGRKIVEGSGKLKSETREVAGFERVRLENRGDLILIQGDEEGLTIQGDDNLLPLIRTEVRGDELVLKLADGYILTEGTIRYTLRVKELSRVSVAGSGDVTARALETDSLSLEISGSGNMNFDDLKASRLTTVTSGSGNFDLAGEVDSQKLTINGSGNYMAGNLKCRETEVQISGAGNATVWAEEKLDIRVSGFGNVEYYGSPEVSERITGGGEVTNLGSHR